MSVVSHRSQISWRHVGKYYVFGGKHGTYAQHRDCWVINLRDLEKGWKKLPEAPWPKGLILPSDYRAAIHAASKRAYILLGTEELLTFNLVTEKWEKSTRTKLKSATLKWKDVFTGQMCDYCFDAIGDTLVVFGGADSATKLGRNRFLSLDMKTKTWDVLSGSPDADPDNTIPGPREQAACWTIGRKVYIGYGNANRARAQMQDHPEGDPCDHNYCDLWSYDLDKKGKWVQEKLKGNFPCPRTETAYTYNQRWKSAVVFGGYAAGMSYRERSMRDVFDFSYFADTFLWDSETKLWRMVLAKGFPTYRARGDMVTDQETGRSYLFGGCEWIACFG